MSIGVARYHFGKILKVPPLVIVVAAVLPWEQKKKGKVSAESHLTLKCILKLIFIDFYTAGVKKSNFVRSLKAADTHTKFHT